MSAQYDSFAREYQATKESPLRLHVEAWSFFNMLGDVAGLEVLDLACGEGFYTRLMAKAGAARVVGVDISAEMIALAEQLESNDPLGISYQCADVAELAEPGKYDVVTAAYLLHYAPDLNALRAMIERIAAALRPGGRFVSINENPAQSFSQHAGYTQYGFNKQGVEPQQDGAAMNYSMISGRKMIRFDVYYYTRETYEALFREAGFSDVQWVGLELEPAGAEHYGADYFAEYMSNPPVTGLVCTL